jgi:hypothetical protein
VRKCKSLKVKINIYKALFFVAQLQHSLSFFQLGGYRSFRGVTFCLRTPGSNQRCNAPRAREMGSGLKGNEARGSQTRTWFCNR